MERHLLEYFQVETFEDGIKALSNKIKLSQQSKLYDYIYIDFIIGIEDREYDQTTIIPKLDLIIKLFTLTFYYRNLIYKCKQINSEALNYMETLMLIKNFSTIDLLKTCFKLLEIF